MGHALTATAKFTVVSWTEQVLVDIDGDGVRQGEAYYPHRGFSHAATGYAYTGDLEASSTLSYLIAYKPGGAPVLGMERVTGTLAGHDGSFVLLHRGHQDEGSVTARLEVVPGMGTGGLEDLTGEAEVRIAGHSDDGYDLVLHYSLGGPSD